MVNPSRRQMFALLGAAPLLVALAVTSLLAAPADEPYALIAGTVFRPTGAAMPSVQVTLTPQPDADSSDKKSKKPKPQKLTSNLRGEFAFRVPAKPMRYTLSVLASGYKPLEKAVQVAGDERQDVSLLLEAGS